MYFEDLLKHFPPYTWVNVTYADGTKSMGYVTEFLEYYEGAWVKVEKWDLNIFSIELNVTINDMP